MEKMGALRTTIFMYNSTVLRSTQYLLHVDTALTVRHSCSAMKPIYCSYPTHKPLLIIQLGQLMGPKNSITCISNCCKGDLSRQVSLHYITWDLQLRALNMSNSTKQVKVMVVSLGVIIPSSI